MSCKEGGTPVCLNVEEADDRNQMIRGSDLATIVPVQIRPREEEGLLDNGILECSVCQKEQQQQVQVSFVTFLHSVEKNKFFDFILTFCSF